MFQFGRSSLAECKTACNESFATTPTATRCLRMAVLGLEHGSTNAAGAFRVWSVAGT